MRGQGLSLFRMVYCRLGSGREMIQGVRGMKEIEAWRFESENGIEMGH